MKTVNKSVKKTALLGRDPLIRCEWTVGDADEITSAIAKAVVHNPTGAHMMAIDHLVGKDKGGKVTVVISNGEGPTVAVDEALESLNMADWRRTCDKILIESLKLRGYDPDKFDWPTPKPEVTKTADDQDVVTEVVVRFRVDAKTRIALLELDERYGVCLCEDCDTEFRYDQLKDPLVVVCPYCHCVQAPCNECPDHGKCGDCEGLKFVNRVAYGKKED